MAKAAIISEVSNGSVISVTPEAAKNTVIAEYSVISVNAVIAEDAIITIIVSNFHILENTVFFSKIFNAYFQFFRRGRFQQNYIKGR